MGSPSTAFFYHLEVVFTIYCNFVISNVAV